jgi:predicted DNA-binding protein
MGLNTMAVHIPQETYRRVAKRARETGKAPEEWTREVIEAALQTREPSRLQTTRDVLQAAGRIHPLSEALRRKIIPGVTLDEVRSALSEAPGPSLSAIIIEQRGTTL